MNNDHVRRWVKNFAEKLLPTSNESFATAVEAAYQQTLTRSPTEAELSDCVAFLEAQHTDYQKQGKADARLLALADFCQTLLSMNEFLYIP